MAERGVKLESGTVVAGKLELLHPIGKGGMGSVWLARHRALQKNVAIKFILPDSAASAVARTRFEREARAAAQIASPHVVQILDYGIEDDAQYIVMEALVGEDLRERLRREQRLGIDAVARLINDVARGLELAHRQGIVHRDLTPANLFIARAGDDELVKILDFGVAKDFSQVSEETTTGALIGSPHYMSPEQARGAAVDARSDLWSLGVIAFAALTGRRPFEGANVGDLVVRICSDAPPRATEIVPELPARVDAFFSKALSKSLDGRFASAREMAEAFQALAHGEDARAVTGGLGAGTRASAASPPFVDLETAPLVEPELVQRRSRKALVLVGLVSGAIAVGSLGFYLSRIDRGAGAVVGPETSARAVADLQERAPDRPPDPVPPATAAAPATTASTSPESAPARPSASTAAAAKGGAPASPARTRSPSPRRRDPVRAEPAPIDPKFGLPVSKADGP